MERLKDIFIFSEDFPLTFTQANFWIFFAVVYFVYVAVHKHNFARSLFLFITSLFFYYKTSGLFIMILLFSTVNDYWLGKWIHQTEIQWKRKAFLITSVVSNLFVLAYFKYAYFFTDQFNLMFHTDYQVIDYLGKWANGFFSTDYFTVDKIILPVGISFYTFQTMSYSFDIYRRELTPVKNIIDFGFFVSFFPQLVAGPIVRAKDFIPQMYQRFVLSKDDLGWAVYMIMKGLTKKIVLADYIAINFIDRVVHDPAGYPGFVSVLAMWGYSLQIYCDFSGYTDIAIGISKLLGFQLNENFNSPYKARNVGEFWKRWHISLSTWLRDYLYIPLGGNRNGTIGSFVALSIVYLFLAIIFQNYFNIVWWAMYIVFLFITIGLILLSLLLPSVGKFLTTDMNLMITMILGGLWHGSSMNFVLWGGMNGLALVIYKYWKRVSPYEKSNLLIVHFWKIFFTFNFITFTRIFFRTPDMETANEMIYHIGNHFDLSWDLLKKVIFEGYPIVFIIMVIGYIVHWLPSGLKDKIMKTFIDLPIVAQIATVAVSGILIYQSVSAEFQPFIYFQF